VKAAHEFEAALMKELVAPMVPGHSTFGDEDPAGSASALGNFAGEALGQALSEQGGFGIAKSIICQLTPQSRSLSNHYSGASVLPSMTQSDTVFSHK
jgi:Rod binding domain-containing protein